MRSAVTKFFVTWALATLFYFSISLSGALANDALLSGREVIVWMIPVLGMSIYFYCTVCKTINDFSVRVSFSVGISLVLGLVAFFTPIYLCALLGFAVCE